jgi:ribonuclease III
MTQSYLTIEKKIALSFANKQLLQTALTHKSSAKNIHHNERLEFLGDSVLNITISDYLYTHYPNDNEGQLTRIRARLVNKPSLVTIATQLNLSDYIMTGVCEKKQSNRHYQESILANALEAIIGAIYLDKGYKATYEWIIALFKQHIHSEHDRLIEKDPKTTLQELCHKQALALPVYQTTQVSGPSHQQTFTIRCTIPKTNQATQGQGSLKRTAQQNAAAAMLQLLEKRECHQ